MDLQIVNKSATEPATSPATSLTGLTNLKLEDDTHEYPQYTFDQDGWTLKHQTTDAEASEFPTSTAQLTPQSYIASTDLLTYIRPEEVGYFDPDYQSEQEPNAAIVSVGKYIWFRDVYMFVTRLKDFVAQGKDIKSVVTSCLRGSALMWYLMELSEEDRAGLRNDVKLEQWYKLLVGRFKVNASFAQSQLLSPSSTYTLANARQNPPRVWAYYMLRLAKSAGFDSTYKQLKLLWNQLHWEIRRYVPEPKPDTALTTFLDAMDSKLPILLEIADRESSYNQPELSQPPPQSQQQDRRRYGARNPQSFPVDDGREQPYLGNVVPNGQYTYCEEAYDEDY